MLPYFIKYNAHTSIVCTWISWWFLAKTKLFLFFKNDFQRNNHCMFIHHKSNLKPFLSYLPCIVCREYFSIIFNVKKVRIILNKMRYLELSICNVFSLQLFSEPSTGCLDICRNGHGLLRQARLAQSRTPGRTISGGYHVSSCLGNSVPLTV